MFRNIALRAFAVLLLLVGMNFLYAHFFFESDLQTHAPIVNSIRELPKDTRILYIGESSNVTTSTQDLDQRAIGDFLSEYYPGLKVGQLTQAAAHAGIFKTYLAAIDPETEIETVVVTLNLRSFNAEWIHSGLETPLRKGTLMLQDRPALWNRFLLAFKAYPVSTEKARVTTVNADWKEEELKLGASFPYQNTHAWKSALEEQESTSARNSNERAKLKLAKEFVCSFAFRIDTLNNPRIADLNDIIELARIRKWRLVFNLMAENVENAQEVCGDDLVGIMQDNRDLLVDYFTRRGVLVVDQLEHVANQDFVDREWPTEHYNQRGRKTIARNLAEALQAYHRGEFEEPKSVHFFNDCEGTLPWANLRTLSTEKAASGKYSSKTDASWEYSINFRTVFSEIPPKARNKVQVSLMVNGVEYNANTLLVLDLKLKSGEQYWKAVALNELTKAKKGWQKIAHTFELESVADEGKLLQIYVYNRSGKELFVDDIDIRFLE